jgi:hypothetical protein
MEQEILNRIQAQDELLQKIYVSTEKTRKYFMWTFIISIAVVVLPLILIAIAAPMLLSSLSGLTGAYGL